MRGGRGPLEPAALLKPSGKKVASVGSFGIISVAQKKSTGTGIVVFSGASLPAPYSILEVGPLGPAGGATERAELGYGAPGAT